MDKYDVKTAHKELYAPSAREFSRVDVPRLSYIAVDGRGDPNTAPAYAEAIESLYTVAYTLKFTSKKELGRDFAVGPLEGLWRAEDVSAFARGDKSAWEWTMVIVLPDWITEEMVAIARETAMAKKQLLAIARLRLMTMIEGPSVQILHIGPYDSESPTIDRMHNEYFPANNLTFNGDHHEIYLSDPRRTAPEKLKTVLRQPVKAAS